MQHDTRRCLPRELAAEILHDDGERIVQWSTNRVGNSALRSPDQAALRTRDRLLPTARPVNACGLQQETPLSDRQDTLAAWPLATQPVNETLVEQRMTRECRIV
jgi:hypothetical protein